MAAHLMILVALLSVRTDTMKAPPPPPPPVPIELFAALPTPQTTPPPPAQTPPSAPAPPSPDKSPDKAPLRRIAERPTPAPPTVPPLPAGQDGAPDSDAEVSDAQLASAATAGSGRAGRPCDMAGRLQAALRKSPLVQAAVAEARAAPGSTGKAILVWNGDWVRRHDQDGNGLAAVREAIMWEVAFAPGVCRAEPVHGLVLLSLNDAPGGARLVVGAGDWRWSDLLGQRPAISGESFSH